jgi:predicted permease
MSVLRRLVLRLTSLMRPARLDREMSREIEAHLGLLEDRFRAEGLSPADARTAARRAFGGVEQVKEQHRDARSFSWLAGWGMDLKLGARVLRKSPGLTIVAGFALAVGVGVGAGFFEFFNEHLYATLPLDEGDRIVAVENWDTATNNEERRSLADFAAWRREARSFEQMGAFRTVTRTLTAPDGRVERVRLAEISASAFRLARVNPRLGRYLSDSDEAEGAARVVVIGHDVWQEVFAERPGIVGTDVRLGGMIHTIVGVMPEGFEFPMNHDWWIPLRGDPSAYPPRGGPGVYIFGRLADGISVARAQAELDVLGQRMAASQPETHERLRPTIFPYTHALIDIQGIQPTEVHGMQAMASLLLFVVAANVAVLAYARTAARGTEIAVRTALGASRARVVGQLLAEALVLTAGAAAVGLALAAFGVRLGNQIMELESGRTPFWIDHGLSLSTAIYAGVLTALAAVIIGGLPALQATGRRARTGLQEAGHRGGGMRLGGTWTGLIATQIAIGTVAVPFVIALGWSEIQDEATVPAFQAEEYLMVRIALDPDLADEPVAASDVTPGQRLAEAGVRLMGEIQALPGVTNLTLATHRPGAEAATRVELDHDDRPDADRRSAGVVFVREDFFEAFDLRPLAGRQLERADVGGVSRAAVVNRSFARQVLATESPLGRRFRYVDEDAAPDAEPTWHQIVGVVDDLEVNPFQPDLVSPVVYHPLNLPTPPAGALLLVRGGGLAGIQDALRETMLRQPDLRVSAIRLDQADEQGRLAASLVALVAGLLVAGVLLLSAAGIYTLTSFTVVQRRREIGIRAALGASVRQLHWSVFSRVWRQIGLGLGAGLAIASLLEWQSNGGIMAGHGLVLLPLAVVLMGTAAMIAAAGPTRRGLRTRVADVLRAE